MAASDSRTLPARLEQLLTPVVADAGLDLEGVEVTPAGRRRVLRIVVDRDGGIDLDGVADVAHAVSEVLDETDVMGAQPYVLEVTSPGTDRPLTEPRHWRRAVGRLVRAELADGTTRTARVLAADAEGVSLEGAGGPERVAYPAVQRARVEVEFGRAGSDPGLDTDTDTDTEGEGEED